MVKEVVIKPVETAASQEIQVQLSMDNNNLLLSPITLLAVQEASMSIEDEDISSTEVFKLPRDTAYGMEDDVPDLVYKKVAIKPAPFLQKTPEPPLPQPPAPQQDERHANGLVEGQPLAPIPLQTSKDADCQDQLDQQLLLQQGDRHANGHVKVSRQVQCETTELCKTL